MRVQVLSVASAAQRLGSIRKPSCQPIALAAAAPKREAPTARYTGFDGRQDVPVRK